MNCSTRLGSAGAAAVLGFLGIVALSTSDAAAATFTVTKVFDTNDGSCDSDCSLREAVIAANLNPGADEIIISRADLVLDLAGSGEGAAATGDLDLLDDVDIRSTRTPFTMLMQRTADRVFEVFSGVDVELVGLKIAGGQELAGVGGGAIRSQGILSTTDCVLVGNRTGNAGPGGAILNSGGVLTLRRSQFVGNIAEGNGGAVANLGGGSALVEDSSFEGNSTREPTVVVGRHGGAIYTLNSPLTLRRSLLLRNHAVADGGALMSDGNTTTVTNCSFVENSATSDGGSIRSARGAVIINSSTFVGSVDSDGGHLQNGPSDTVTVSNSVFSDGNPMNCQVSGTGTVSSAGFNLDDDGSCGFSQPTDLVGAAGISGLARVRGSTEVVSLCTAAGSPSPQCTGLSAAVDAGNPAAPGSGGTACPAEDQTGASRPEGARCDIGAFEAEPSQCETDLTQCQNDLTDCSSDITVCSSDLTQCQTTAAQTQAALAVCESDLVACVSGQATCFASLATAEAALAAATVDTDQDTQRDVDDDCPGTSSGEPVDQIGCSLAQFCATFDASAREGRRACKRADWNNDEPGMRRRDRDCMVEEGACVPTN